MGHSLKPPKGGLVRVIRATEYSRKGLIAAIQHEAAFRQELAFFILLSPLGYWLGETGVERALLIGALFLVLIVELLNSALEAAIDRVGIEKHKLAGRAKDMGSAAVFLSITSVAVIWALILLPHYIGS